MATVSAVVACPGAVAAAAAAAIRAEKTDAVGVVGAFLNAAALPLEVVRDGNLPSDARGQSRARHLMGS